MAGIAPAARFPQATALEDWISRGFQADMDWMARDPRTRADIRSWYPEARSILVLGFSYADNSRRAPPESLFSRYSLLPDYHRKLKKLLLELRDWLKELHPGADARAFVDSSPVLERLAGYHAGLGWFGKSTMLVSPRLGSYFFLAGLALNLELEPDSPIADHCGSCRRCVEACPTKALGGGGMLDARRCISYLTIEHKGAVPEALRPRVGSWAAGCDICQEVCPFNRFARPGAVFAAPPPSPALPLPELAGLDEEGYRRCFSRTGASRLKRGRLVRNAALAMGNSGDPSHAPALRKLSKDPDPAVQEQARWSLARCAS